ncbi:MAG: hypothetical protein M3N38_04690, partial [Pseudomonadota bacterium]|nr:hypothetical protein [Pseudomonadota bacterium]
MVASHISLPVAAGGLENRMFRPAAMRQAMSPGSRRSRVHVPAALAHSSIAVRGSAGGHQKLPVLPDENGGDLLVLAAKIRRGPRGSGDRHGWTGQQKTAQ